MPKTRDVRQLGGSLRAQDRDPGVDPDVGGVRRQQWRRLPAIGLGADERASDYAGPRDAAGRGGHPDYADCITAGSPLSTSVTFGSFSTISELCVTWHFTGDLFDEGETVFVTWGGGGGGGASNLVGTGGPRRLQTLCMGDQATKDLLLDGTEAFTLSVSGGSVTVGAVVISVTGDSTPPVGYRVATDAFLYTVQAGSSVDVTTTLTDDVGPTPDTALTARNLVPDSGFSTTPSSGFPTYSSTGTLSTSASTPPGDYALIVTGRGGGFNRTAETTIRVTAAPPSSSLVVNSTNDVADGACNATHCSLRDAITAANAASGADTITFSIGLPLGGQKTIPLTSALPTIVFP